MIRALGNTLARHSAVAGRDRIDKATAAPRSQRIRIWIAVGLAVRIRRPRRRTRVDGEGRTRVGDAVIRQHPRRCVQRSSNVIRAARYRLTRITAVTRRHVVRKQESSAATVGQWNRIRNAVGLAVVIRRPGGIVLVNRLQDVAVARQVNTGGCVASRNCVRGHGEGRRGEVRLTAAVEIRRARQCGPAARAVVESNTTGGRTATARYRGCESNRVAIRRWIQG